MHRHLAELLVDGGFASRDEVESAVHESTERNTLLSEVLIERGKLSRHEITAVRRLQALLTSPLAARLATEGDDDLTHATGLRLGDLLLDSGSISRRDLDRALRTHQLTGRKLADVLVSEGFLGEQLLKRERQLQKKLMTAAVGAAMAFSYVMSQPKAEEKIPGPAISQTEPVAPTRPDVDQRFASLGDVSAYLKNMRPAHQRARSVAPGLRKHVRKFGPYVERYAQDYSLPPEILYAMIETESSFNHRARSRANAIGLMQLIPGQGGQAAYSFVSGEQSRPSIKQLMDPETNIQLGAAYMRVLLDDHFSRVRNKRVRMGLALAAYNWGPARVEEMLRVEGVPGSVDELLADLERHAPAETHSYVRKITRRMVNYSTLA